MQKRTGITLACCVVVFGLCSPPLPAQNAPAPPLRSSNEIVAFVGNTPIPSTRLDDAVGTKSLAMEAQIYRLRRNILQGVIDSTLLDVEAKQRGMPVNELVRQEIEQKTAAVKPEEVKAVYESARDRFATVSEADALESIRSSMQQGRLKARRETFLAQLRRKIGVRVLLEARRVEVDVGGNPARGPANAPVTIVVFSDYACAFCSRLAATMKRIGQQYGESVRIAYRDFPLPIHKEAAKAAEAAVCASQQTRFWDMHEKLFTNQQRLTSQDLKRYAVDLGLDTDRFNQCLDSSRHAAEVERDRRDGERLGIAGTPATFINGRLIPGAMAYEEYASAIEEELQRLTPIPPHRQPGR